MKHAMLSKTMLVMMLLLFMSSVAIVNAEPTSSIDDGGEDPTTTTTDSLPYDAEHEPGYTRDEDGTVWIETNVMTVRLDSRYPSYDYWYTPDVNGSLARFQASYLMIIEFEDQNGDGVYQINETVQFAPLEVFDWHLKTGACTDENGTNHEVYASYIKGGLSCDGFDDDWFKDWMPGYGEGESLILAEGDGEENDPCEEPVYPVYDTMNLTRFKHLTLQFYSHIYMEDHYGKVKDNDGPQAHYTIEGGVELKTDIKIGNFPYLSNTSKVTVLNYLKEDLAINGENHKFKLYENDAHTEVESEVAWETTDDLGELFNDVNGVDVQELALIGSTSGDAHGYYRWVDKALEILPDGNKSAVNVSASYWANGDALLLFFAYPNFDGGSLYHDPSMKLVEDSAPVEIPTVISLGEIPVELTLGAAAIGIGTIALVAIVMKRR